MPEKHSKETLSIKRIRDLSYRLGFPAQLLESIADTAENYYVFWKKKKPSGKYRELGKVRQPLKRVQKAIHRLLQEIHVPDCAHGGVKGKSNITNAQKHCKSNTLLTLDLENFFPSISHHRVYGLFRNELDCSPDVARILTKLCTARKMVPQGAPTSTDIANLVLRRTDMRLGGFAAVRGKEYSRFVDDMSLSGDQIANSEVAKIKAIVDDSGFALNDEKEAITGRDENQLVTGLLIKYKKPRIPRKVKRDWRKKKHQFEKFGKLSLNRNAVDKAKQRIDGFSNYQAMVENPPNASGGQ